ncbi:MAG TPA: energy transducer TonB [Thermoanaerobaculia bacterium]|nr:energy transducer TonB [Thermoanaerobaculia bacterium]
MFDVSLETRRRPNFGLSAALHAALGFALVVPPLLATPEPPEPDGFVKISWGPSLTSHAPRIEKVVFLRKGNGDGAPAPPARASDQPRRAAPALVQPKELTELLPAPTGEESELPFEESSGERSEPGTAAGTGTRGSRDDEGGDGCEGCRIISATAPGVTPPVALSTPSPSYPELARRAHVEGVVLLEAIIGSDGLVRDARVLRSANFLLEAPALEAVRRWRYRAATVEGRSVPVYLTVVVTFSLR